MRGSLDAPAPPPTATLAPQGILEASFVNIAFDTTSPTWAKDVVGGGQFLSLLNSTPFEWTQILDPAAEYDASFVGLSGWVIVPDLSDEDNPFLHPFGFDWKFYFAPDSGSQWLAAPTNNTLYAYTAGLAPRSRTPSLEL
jgi:hypothetical protein